MLYCCLRFQTCSVSSQVGMVVISTADPINSQLSPQLITWMGKR